MGAVAMASVGIAAAIDQIDLEDQYISGISARYHRIHRDVVEIGGLLVEARKNLPYGQFQRMLATKLPFSQRTAYNYITEWTIAQQDVQPVAQLSDRYSVRHELERLSLEEMEKGIASGRLYQGMPRAEVIQFRREERAQHQHRPVAIASIPAPRRPEGGGATCYPELIYLITEWRKSLGISQAALDDKIGCAEGQTSKYEIPHQDDGRQHSWASFFQTLQALGLSVALVKAP